MMIMYPGGLWDSSLRGGLEGHPGSSWYDTAVTVGKIGM